MFTSTIRRVSIAFLLAILGVLALAVTSHVAPGIIPGGKDGTQVPVMAVGMTPHFAPRTAADPAEKPTVRKVEIAHGVYLEVQGKGKDERRRVLVSAKICLQKGALELLMTRADTKEHEAVLTADIDARMLKQALILTNAKEGAPVKFDPKYKPATGQAMRITAMFEEKGKLVTINTKEWVRNANNKQTLNHDWVFAGSQLLPNPLDPKKTIFLANYGDIVCVSNFEGALLDLPIRSSKEAADLVWEANTEKIPAIGTPVTVIFEPLPEKK